MSFQQLLEAALALPKSKRSRLRDELTESLDQYPHKLKKGETKPSNAHLEPEDEHSLSPEWLAEIQRRSDEIDHGTAKLMSAAEFKRRTDRLKRSVQVKR